MIQNTGIRYRIQSIGIQNKEYRNTECKDTEYRVQGYKIQSRGIHNTEYGDTECRKTEQTLIQRKGMKK